MKLKGRQGNVGWFYLELQLIIYHSFHYRVIQVNYHKYFYKISLSTELLLMVLESLEQLTWKMVMKYYLEKTTVITGELAIDYNPVDELCLTRLALLFLLPHTGLSSRAGSCSQNHWLKSAIFSRLLSSHCTFTPDEMSCSY